MAFELSRDDDCGESREGVVEAVGSGAEAGRDASFEAQHKPAGRCGNRQPLERFRVGLETGVGEDQSAQPLAQIESTLLFHRIESGSGGE